MTGPSSRSRIVPESTPMTAPFWAAARRGELLLQVCRECECGHAWHPPAPVCPRCRSEAYDWVASAGRGRLYSWTRVEHAVHPAVADRLGYRVALVDLAEGPRVVCTLVDVADEADLGPSTVVTIGLGPAAGGLELPVARPLRERSGRE
jgi:uncharacterized OB-fold protein